MLAPGQRPRLLGGLRVWFGRGTAIIMLIVVVAVRTVMMVAVIVTR